MKAIATAGSYEKRLRSWKACIGCRSAKQKCTPAPGAPSGLCLRCYSKGLTCQYKSSGGPGMLIESDDDPNSHEERIIALEAKVKRLEHLLESREDPKPHAISLVSADSAHAPQQGGLDEQSAHSHLSISAPPHMSLIHEMDFDTNGSSLMPLDPQTDKIIPKALCDKLVDVFVREYTTRWTPSLHNIRTSDMAAYLAKQSSFLYVCVLCIASRHTNLTTDADSVRLALEAKRLQGLMLQVSPPQVETLEAILLLSMASTTGLGFKDKDSWLLSGYGCQLSITTVATTISMVRARLHLYLIHLHYCIGMQRPCIISARQIHTAKQVLAFADSTNRDYRMVAELELYFRLYCCVEHPDSQLYNDAFERWQEDWAGVFGMIRSGASGMTDVAEQERSYFIEIGYNAAKIIKEMIGRREIPATVSPVAARIMEITKQIPRESGEQMTDMVYYNITFAALLLCKSRAAQLVEVAGIPEILHAFGARSPQHIAHRFADLVSRIYTRTIELQSYEMFDFAAAFPEINEMWALP